MSVSCALFFQSLIKNDIGFFTGVPDSLLKDICAYINDNSSTASHIIAANEGGAVALACGYHLSTGKIPLVYLQNSGLGNVINPLLSLADKEVYSIPLVFMIGWRGEPGVKDEPQHKKQGRVQNSMLEVMEVPFYIFDPEQSIDHQISKAIKQAAESSAPVALVIREGSFEPYVAKVNSNEDDLVLTRELAIQEIIEAAGDEYFVVSTTGKSSRELYEYRQRFNKESENDFLIVGGMGHASQIALGLALNSSRKVLCLDGDGAAIMHLGAFAITGSTCNRHFLHILINNGAHESVGGQPTAGFKISFTGIANSCGYTEAKTVTDATGIRDEISRLKQINAPVLLEVRVKCGSRKELGRPKTTPADNKLKLMQTVVNS